MLPFQQRSYFSTVHKSNQTKRWKNIGNRKHTYDPSIRLPSQNLRKLKAQTKAHYV